MRFRDRLQRFMSGRYGVDEYSMFLMITALILMTIFGIPAIRNWNAYVYMVVYILTMAMLIYSVYRTYSRNINKRYKERVWFLNKTKGIRNTRSICKRKWADRKYYKYVKCDTCYTYLRVPKGKGKIKVHCPKCGKDILTKS